MKNKTMKKVLTSITIMICSFSFGQTVNGYKLNEIPADYIEIVGASKLLKPMQVSIYVDYGQIAKMKDISKGYVIGEDGKKAPFNGMMGVLNVFSKNGWELDQTLMLTVGGANVAHFILKRKK